MPSFSAVWGQGDPACGHGLPIAVSIFFGDVSGARYGLLLKSGNWGQGPDCPSGYKRSKALWEYGYTTYLRTFKKTKNIPEFFFTLAYVEELTAPLISISLLTS
jgi:hypothetical protein